MFQCKSPTRRQAYNKRKLLCACCKGRTWKPRRWVSYHLAFCCRNCACIRVGFRWECLKHPRPPGVVDHYEDPERYHRVMTKFGAR